MTGPRRYYAALFDNAVVIGSAVTQVLGVAAQRFGIYLSVGIDEREPVGSTLYSTQLLFGPDGSLLSAGPQAGAHRGERLVWGDGDGSGLEVVETPYGRIGTLIGWESYLPMARRRLYAQGVDIYLAPARDNSDVWRRRPAAHRQGGRRLRGGCSALPAGSSDLPEVPARPIVTCTARRMAMWTDGNLCR